MTKNDKDELQELRWLFKQQHKRMSRATKLWQKSTGKTDVLPDLGDLLEWLMGRAAENHKMWAHWQNKYVKASGELSRTTKVAKTYEKALHLALTQRNRYLDQVHSALYILEEMSLDGITKATGLPKGTVAAALRNIK